MTLFGIDGCKGGWVVAEAPEDLSTVRFWIAPTAAEVFVRVGSDTLVAIDIPIGLPTSERRACDLEARRRLTPHTSRVFSAPARAALGASDYRQCCALNEAALGVGLTKQSHGLLPKIREVDEAMTAERQFRVREAHPEVTFLTLKGEALTHSKKTVAGHIERIALLQAQGLTVGAVEGGSLESLCAPLDDVLDAAACLVTAKRIHEGRGLILGDGALDGRGLRMEIVV
jgi:predicted RNase H-like nuclease